MIRKECTMKNNFARRSAAGILAAAMILSAASCGSSSEDKKTKPQQTADQVVENSYRAVDMDVALDLSYVEQICALGDTGKVMISGSTEEESVLYITDTEFQDIKKVDLGIEMPENSTSYFRSVVDPSGNIISLVNVTDFGSAKLPDYDSPDFDYENFDFDALYKNAKTTYYKVTVDSSGEVVSKSELSGYEKYIQTEDDEEGAPAELYFDSILPAPDDEVIVMISGNDGARYAVIKADGSFGDEIEFGEDVWFYSACTDPDGKAAFSDWDDNGAVIRFIDTKARKLSDKKISLKDTDIDNVGTIIRGSGDYALYISTTTSLYGLKEDGTADEMINWLDSDLNGDYIRGIIPTGDGDFIIYEQDWSGPSPQGAFYRLTKRDVSELENTIVVNLGLMYTDSSVTTKVNEFNKSNDKYRIRITDYSKYDEWDDKNEKMTNTGSKQLKMDIIAGNAPDMIYTYDMSLVKSLASKGVFTDMNSFLGTDGTPGKDEFLPCVLDAGTVDGQLLAVSPTFNVSTMAAKKKFVDHDNWTLDELIEIYDNLPEGTKLFRNSDTKEGVFHNLTNGLSSFVDMDTNSCSFDSDEFIKVLEFANRFPDEEEGEPDWDNASQDEMDKYYAEQQNACRNDKALVSEMSLFSIREYAQLLHGEFGEDISLVGFPSDDGKGGSLTLGTSFSILSDTANKEACWQFISTFFSDDAFSKDSYSMGGIPALKTKFAEMLDSAMDRPYWEDENGKKQYYDDTYWIGDNEEPVKIDPLTQEQRDYIEEYILNCCSGSIYINDEDIRSIVQEEIKSYFAGEKSASDTAANIQNRVSLLLSEQG